MSHQKKSSRGNSLVGAGWRGSLIAAGACTALAGGPVLGETLMFVGITSNNATSVMEGEDQLSVEVTDVGGGQVAFAFHNVGAQPMSITDVYFDDGSLLGIAQIIDADEGVGGDPGVDFSQGASPMNLPGGNLASPPFEATSGFTADSDAPVPQKGVNPSETLIIVYDLQAGRVFGDVISELTNGELRIGMHVQSFASGPSESFVNAPIPEPGAVSLLMVGGLLLRGGRKGRGRRGPVTGGGV